MDFPTVKVGPNDKTDHLSIFRLELLGGLEADPKVARPPPYGGPDELLQPTFAAAALRAKRKEWVARGRMTHGDVKYVAACILRGAHGQRVASLVAQRFPVILVDELQDTSWFLGRALVPLLQAPGVQALLVGDPDQGIYGFGGADRRLFDEIANVEGCRELPLRETHRCPRRIAAVASALARSGMAVTPKDGAAEGRAMLLAHTEKRPTLSPELRARIEREVAGCKDVALLLRKTAPVRSLTGVRQVNDCPLHSTVGRRLQSAVRTMEWGDTANAAKVIARDLGHLLLDDPSPTLERFLEAGISQRDWRRACFALLAEAARYPTGENWGAWLARMKDVFGQVSIKLTGAPPENLGRAFRRSTDRASEPRLREPHTPPATSGWLVETVHKVKGREFEAVVYYAPKPHATAAKCPSEAWWDADPLSEEREVAFVMTSRASKVLILCVHEETHRRLRANRAEFTALFQPISMADE